MEIGQEIKSEPMVEQMAAMSDFTSDINDVLIPQENVNGRVVAPSIQYMPSGPSKKKNPFNLTDEQMSAILAGIVGVIAHLPMVQSKLPQAGGDIQKMIMNLILIALLFFFAMRFYKNR